MSDNVKRNVSPEPGPPDQQYIYKRKYKALKKKCEEIQETNEKLVNRIQHVKRILKRDKKINKFIMNRLDRYGDNYMDVYVPAMFDDIGVSETLLHSPKSRREMPGLGLSRDVMDGKAPPNVNPFLNIASSGLHANTHHRDDWS